MGVILANWFLLAPAGAWRSWGSGSWPSQLGSWCSEFLNRSGWRRSRPKWARPPHWHRHGGNNSPCSAHSAVRLGGSRGLVFGPWIGQSLRPDRRKVCGSAGLRRRPPFGPWLRGHLVSTAGVDAWLTAPAPGVWRYCGSYRLPPSGWSATDSAPRLFGCAAICWVRRREQLRAPSCTPLSVRRPRTRAVRGFVASVAAASVLAIASIVGFAIVRWRRSVSPAAAGTHRMIA